MPRLRNLVTGAVMSVSEATAARLDSEWVPADEQKSELARRGRASKSDSNE